MQLKSIKTTYHLSPTQGAWVLSATGIVAAATIPLLSKLGDIYGLRRLLLVTLVTVALGNVICALASGPTGFIFGRAIIGINAGQPLYYGILRARSHRKDEVDRYSGMMTLAIGVAVVLGFLFGGIIIQSGGSARLALWIIAGVSIALVGVVWLLVEEVPFRVRVSVDYLGAVLIGSSLAAVVTAFSQANSWHWGSVKVIGLLVLGAVLFAAWVAWEFRCAHPLVNLRELTRREMWPGIVAAGMATLIGVNALLLITNYVQTPKRVGYGFTASVLTTSLYLIPAGVAVAFGGLVIVRVIDRIGQRLTVIVGGAIAVLVFLAFSGASTPIEFLAFTALIGLSYSFIYTGGVTIYLRGARPGEQGVLPGVARATQNALVAIGPALITTILTASLIPKLPVPESGNYGHVMLVWAGFSVIVIVIGLFVRESRLEEEPLPEVELVQPSSVQPSPTPA